MSELGQKLISIVRAKAAANPNFIYDIKNDGVIVGGYPACVYVKDGQPSCIIGQALFEAGLITTSFEDTPANSHPFDHLAVQGSVPELQGLDAVELQWLRNVQFAQDGGKSWADAVQRADNPVITTTLTPWPVS